MRVLLVEDDPVTVQSVEMMLKSEGMVVDSTDLGEDGLEIGKLYDYDIIVLDLMLPDINGLEVLRRLRNSRIETPVLILSGLGESENKVRGLGVGADDYLSKPFEPRELVLRIEAILRRGGPKQEEVAVATFGACSFDIERGELTRDGAAVRLTSGEVGMLRLFARSPGVTVGRAELLAQADAGNVRAVDVQITRLRRKIEVDPKEPRHLCTVWGQGYVFWLD